MTTREQQLKYCKRCKNRKMDLKQGLICSLTGQKADFYKECPDFIFDEEEHYNIKKKEKQVIIKRDERDINISTYIIFFLAALFIFISILLIFNEKIVFWFSEEPVLKVVILLSSAPALLPTQPLLYPWCHEPLVIYSMHQVDVVSQVE